MDIEKKLLRVGRPSNLGKLLARVKGKKNGHLTQL